MGGVGGGGGDLSIKYDTLKFFLIRSWKFATCTVFIRSQPNVEDTVCGTFNLGVNEEMLNCAIS